MNQHLTVSKTIVKYLNDSLSALEHVVTAHDVMDTIKQNYIVSDKTKRHSQDIISELEKIDDLKKKEYLTKIIGHWIYDRSKFVDCDLSLVTTTIELAKLTCDQIYFDPSLTWKERDNLRGDNSSVEIHNEKSLIKPQDVDRLKNCPDTIKLRNNIKYDIITLFEPYLREAKEITFQDPYLPNHRAFYNFKLLVENVNVDKIMAIIHSRKNYARKNDRTKEMRYDEFVEYTNKKNIHLSEWKSHDHKERYIITDELEIYIPGGLDIFNKDGTARISEPDKEIKKISISPRKYSDE